MAVVQRAPREPKLFESSDSRDALGRPHTDNNGYTPISINSIRQLPNRRAIAKALAAGLPVAPLRDREGVRFLQQAMVELGLMDAKAIRFAAGNYGQRTQTAVSEIQASLGRTLTGMYDDAVRGHLLYLLDEVHDAPSSAGNSCQQAPQVALTGPPGDCTATLHYTDVATADRVPRETLIRDARPLQAQGQLSLGSHGFSLTQHETLLTSDDFYYNRGLIQSLYYKETEELIKRELGADRVFTFAHQVRNGGKATGIGTQLNAFADGSNVASYAGVVHTDFTASKSAEKFFRVSGIPAGVKVRYVLLNTWRNISEADPVYNNPLACLDSSNISSKDLVRVDELLKPGAACRDYHGTVQAHRECAEQYRLTAERAAEHQWFYYPHMRKGEVLLFKQFDSDPKQRARFTFHSSFTDGSVAAQLPPRESVETRAIAIFIEADSSLKQTIVSRLVLESDPLFTLQSRLAARGARGLLDPTQVEALADKAALANIPADEVLRQLSKATAQRGGNNTQGLPPQGVRLHSAILGEPSAVMQLQLVLIELGIMDAYAIKYGAGQFGPETSAAVKRIQNYLRLPSNGVYDDAVRALLVQMLEETGAH